MATSVGRWRFPAAEASVVAVEASEVVASVAVVEASEVAVVARPRWRRSSQVSAANRSAKITGARI